MRLFAVILFGVLFSVAACVQPSQERIEASRASVEEKNTRNFRYLVGKKISFLEAKVGPATTRKSNADGTTDYIYSKNKRVGNGVLLTSPTLGVPATTGVLALPSSLVTCHFILTVGKDKIVRRVTFTGVHPDAIISHCHKLYDGYGEKPYKWQFTLV